MKISFVGLVIVFLSRKIFFETPKIRGVPYFQSRFQRLLSQVDYSPVRTDFGTYEANFPNPTMAKKTEAIPT